jgi:hypothetical protein
MGCIHPGLLRMGMSRLVRKTDFNPLLNEEMGEHSGFLSGSPSIFGIRL